MQLKKTDDIMALRVGPIPQKCYWNCPHAQNNIPSLTLTTLNPSKSIPLYWKILADSGYLHIEHVADFDGFRISIVFNCLVMLADGL